MAVACGICSSVRARLPPLTSRPYPYPFIENSDSAAPHLAGDRNSSGLLISSGFYCHHSRRDPANNRHPSQRRVKGGTASATPARRWPDAGSASAAGSRPNLSVLGVSPDDARTDPSRGDLLATANTRPTNPVRNRVSDDVDNLRF